MRSRWLLAMVAVLAITGMQGASFGTPGPAPAIRHDRPVALVLVRELTWATAPPVLDRFAKASLSMRTVEPRGSAADVYLTLSKGQRAAALDGQGLGRLEVGPGGGVRLADWDELERSDRRSAYPGRLGAVGQTLLRSGRQWVLVTGDQEAAAVAATASGSVPTASFGGVDALERALVTRPDVLVVSASRAGLPRVVDRLAGVCTLVASASTPAGNRHLGVFAASQACGLGPGGLGAASTHQPHLVTLPDVTMTLLHLGGVNVPAAVTPTPDATRADLVERNLRARTGDRSRPVFVGLFIALHVVGGAVAMRWRRARVGVCCTLLAVPAASFLMMLVPWWRGGTLAGLFVGGGFTGALAVPAALAASRRGGPRRSVAALAGFTAGLIAVDALLGSPLQVDAPFGNSPVVGARFFGVGNIGSGLLVASLLNAGGLALDRWGRPALPYVAAVLAGGAIAGGAPQFGADVGGVLFAVPAFGLLLLGVRVGRIRARHVALLGGAAALALALFAMVDLARAAGGQTHLARSLGSELVPDVLRKAQLAARTVTNPLGIVVVVALVTLAVTRYSPGGRPAIRYSTYALVVAAALGSTLNDSGVIVAASVGALAWPSGVLVRADDAADLRAPPALTGAPARPAVGQ